MGLHVLGRPCQQFLVFLHLTNCSILYFDSSLSTYFDVVAREGAETNIKLLMVDLIRKLQNLVRSCKTDLARSCKIFF